MSIQNQPTSGTNERWITAQYINADGTIDVYPDYLVSDQGRVASIKKKSMKIMKQSPCDKYRHLAVWLRVDNKRHFRTVHRLTLSSFHPEYYFKGAEVDHINRDVTDNNLDNLRFVDHNTNNTNKIWNPVKPIRVTYLSENGRTEDFDNMADCSKAFGKGLTWCISIIRKHNGFHKRLNIKIEKIL